MSDRMRNLQRLVTLSAAFCVCCSGATAASAQDRPEDWPQFDCLELLQGIQEHHRVIDLADLPIAVVADDGDRRGGDPPIVGSLRADPRLAVSTRELEVGGERRVLACIMLHVEPILRSDSEPRLEIIATSPGGEPNESSAGLKLLMVGLSESTTDWEDWLGRLSQLRVARNLEFEATLPLDSSEGTRREGYSAHLEPGSFSGVPFFGEDAREPTSLWNSQNLRRIVLGENQRSFRSPPDVFWADEGPLVLLCGADSCRELMGSVLREPHDPTTGAEHQLTGMVSFRLFRRDRSMSTNLAPQLAERFDCSLYSLSPELFASPPDGCDPEIEEETIGCNAAVVITDDGWVIACDERGPSLGRDNEHTPQRIEVTLPEGRLGTRCSIQVRYSAGRGEPEAVLQLDAMATRTGPNRFGGDVSDPVDVDGSTVQLTLIPSSEPDCGGPERVAEVQVNDLLEVPLVQFERRLRGVVHLIASSEADLMVELGFDHFQLDAFGRGMIDAIIAAHARVAAIHGTRSWSLVAGEVARLEPRGGTETMLRLDQNELTNESFEFDEIRAYHNDVVRGNVSLTAGGLSDSLRSVVQRQAADGVDRLTLVVLGGVLRRDVLDEHDPCVDPLYQDLAARLSADSIEVEIVAIPIVKLLDTNTNDLSRLVPLGDGFFACRGAGLGVAVLPFFVESWRSPADVTPRFVAGLAERLAEILTNVLTDGELGP